MLKCKNIDNGKAFDWGLTSSAYARYRGIAQQTINQVEIMYNSYGLWKLDTIMQEKKNCHLYEKLGNEKTGQHQKINKRMTLIYYEKRKRNE